jgi:hypothetical protein
MNKYRNIKTEIAGHKFDSRKEAKYAVLYKAWEQEGKISNLRMQVPYEIVPAVWEDETIQLKTKEKIVRKCRQRASYYVADFVYTDNETGKEVVVDVKSKITRSNAVYRLKKKMMYAFNGIEIKEV